MSDTNYYLGILRVRAEQLDVLEFFKELLDQYSQFIEWPGSHSFPGHHYEKGGLIRHTYEIIEMGMQIIPTLNLCDKLNISEFYLAALFHDTGKMFDYKQTFPNQWEKADHRKLIYHIPRSSLIWHDICKSIAGSEEKYHDQVLHAILSHHGIREYGSPVEPQTRVAWLLHLCDGISARMDDSERTNKI